MLRGYFLIFKELLLHCVFKIGASARTTHDWGYSGSQVSTTTGSSRSRGQLLAGRGLDQTTRSPSHHPVVPAATGTKQWALPSPVTASSKLVQSLGKGLSILFIPHSDLAKSWGSSCFKQELNPLFMQLEQEKHREPVATSCSTHRLYLLNKLKRKPQFWKSPAV